jgi:galactofuranose transport system substrate-binding protein
MRRTAMALLLGVMMFTLAACGSAEPQAGDDPAAEETAGGGEGGDDTITLGFSQVGAESGWRTANTQSIQESAEEAGIDLQFSDGQQRQENQIRAIRSFIQQGVDVIGFAPVVTTGWDPVLREARDAGIPVILTDRTIETEDETLWTAFLGSDFREEGVQAGEWLAEEFADAEGPVNIVELQGTAGSAPAIERKEGFESVIGEDDRFQVIATQDAEFTRARGKEVMQAFLQSHDDIDVLYAHNDDMALGAIEAIEEAGLVPGEDITIVSVDAVRDGMEALAEGRINFIVECNPLLGPQLMELVQQVANGEDFPRVTYTEETTFTPEQAAEVLPDRLY